METDAKSDGSVVSYRSVAWGGLYIYHMGPILWVHYHCRKTNWRPPEYKREGRKENLSPGDDSGCYVSVGCVSGGVYGACNEISEKHVCVERLGGNRTGVVLLAGV